MTPNNLLKSLTICYDTYEKFSPSPHTQAGELVSGATKPGSIENIMTQTMQQRTNSEHKSWALIFLVSFVILGLVSVWLIYQQFAQVFTRQGQCTVLAIQTRQDPIDLDNPTTGAAQYSITFTVSLLTPEGQHLRVPGYYTSTNFDASTQSDIKNLEKTYAVGSTSVCGYTYLDPSGIKAIFQPTIPAEGFYFPGFFLLVSLVISIICVVMMRRGPAPEPPLPAETDEVESEEIQHV